MLYSEYPDDTVPAIPSQETYEICVSATNIVFVILVNDSILIFAVLV